MPFDGKPRILFAGTPEFAVPPLQALVDAGFAPLAVFTQPDRPAGRGRKLRAGPVKQAAVQSRIPVHQPESLKTGEERERLRGLRPDLLVVVAYGLILPQDILSIPVHGCWNIHASLLPRWRGAAPIQRAIEAGDPESGVCIMQMDAGLDTGPVMHRVALPLQADETGGSLHDRLAVAGAEAIVHCVRALARGAPLPAVPQPEHGASYARKLDKSEARIDWSREAGVIERKVRAFNPWPVAWCLAGDERVRVWMAESTGVGNEAPPGTVLNACRQGIEVATGDGVLRLLELQRPGKRRAGAADFINAGRLPDTLA